MKDRDIISSAGFFTSSVVKEPQQTLRNTFRGAWEGSSDLEGVSKYSTPFFGLAGLGLIFGGAVTGDPLAAGLGAINVAGAAGRYLEVGNHLATSESHHPAPRPKPPHMSELV